MMRQSHRIRRFVATKRVFDTVIVVALSPLLVMVSIIVTIAVLIGMGRPVFFVQPRIGLHGEVFSLFKFRSMKNDCDRDGNLLSDRERLTFLGKMLRVTSLDEIPQFMNVLRGDMAIVGPRPLLVHYLPHYSAREKIRHEVRPGITGLSQVSGRNDLSWEDRLELDVTYVEKASFRLDLWIIAQTVEKVVKRENATPIPGDFGEPLDIERGYPQSRNFRLRRFEYRNVPLRVQWFSDPDIRRYMRLPAGVTIDSTIKWLTRVRKEDCRRDFVVTSKDTGVVVAMVGLKQEAHDELPEVYIIVGPDYQGKGIGGESLSLLLAWVRSSQIWPGVKASVHHDNIRSLKMFERCGFVVTESSDDRYLLEWRYEDPTVLEGKNNV